MVDVLGRTLQGKKIDGGPARFHGLADDGQGQFLLVERAGHVQERAERDEGLVAPDDDDLILGILQFQGLGVFRAEIEVVPVIELGEDVALGHGVDGDADDDGSRGGEGRGRHRALFRFLHGCGRGRRFRAVCIRR